MEESDYKDRQLQHDKEYIDAWKNAPQSFRKKAMELGLTVDPEERESMVMPFDSEYDNGEVRYDNDYQSGAHLPDMASLIDTYLDKIIEEYETRIDPRLLVEIFEKLQLPMKEELVRCRADLLGRVAGFLVCDNKGNILARVHALLHSIPRCAAAAGFPSLRASAKKCRVSAEWLRRTRDKCCSSLGVDVPAEGRKSETAKLKYSLNGKINHWRTQKYKNGKQPC